MNCPVKNVQIFVLFIHNKMLMWKTYRDRYCMAWIMVILVLTKMSNCYTDDLEPGQCLSKFDYDYKVMQKLLQFEREIQELKQRNSCKDTQQVAFMAQLSKQLADPPIGTTVVFDTVYTNVGNGYKHGPGIFVAPVDGTYSINLVASSSTKSTSASLDLYIMRNTSKVGYIFLDHNSDRWLLRSATIVLELKAEDTIYVKIGHKTVTGMLAGCCFHTHFSGFLIH